MKNDKFICPICGSTHFEHIISKTHPNIFGVRCIRCAKYAGWLPKSLYNQWRNGLVNMDEITLSSDTQNYIDTLKFFIDHGFKKINAHTLSNESYTIRLDKHLVIDKETGEKTDIDKFIENS